MARVADRSVAVLTLAALVCAPAFAADAGAEAAASANEAASAGGAPVIETVAEGLRFPWCIAFLPDGDMLVTERGGGLRRVRPGSGVVADIAGVPAVYERSQGGLFDVMLDRDFERSGTLFLSYAHGTPDANVLRVARARLVDDALTDVTVLFDTAPTKDTPVHYGGRMVQLPDGSLLVTTGDGFDYREQAQRLDNTFGKTVRIRDDGTVPDDNPFVDRDGARPEIWTYGHRNPQGLVVDGRTGLVYLHEHGPRGGDELNVLEPGLNYGWPVTTFGLDYSGAKISPFTERPGMRQPLVHWTPSIAPAGMAWYGGAVFPEWQGDLFVAALVEKSVRRIELRDGRVTSQEVLFEDLGERIRDVRAGPDGRLYLLTDSEQGRVLAVGR